MISALSLLLISSLILLDKRLQMHPNKLLAYACLCDAYGFCQFATRYMVCGHSWSGNLDMIYANTVQVPMRKVFCVFTFKESYNTCWAKNQSDLDINGGVFPNTSAQRLESWYFLTLFFSYCGLTLNTCIIYDLKQVISNPFVNSEKRILKYQAIAAVSSLVFTSIGLGLTTSRDEVAAEWNYRLYQIIALSNCALATYVVVWLTIRFRKPGISGKIKRQIRARYIEYVVLYAMFSWPSCVVTKPSYRYYSTLRSYVGGTVWIGPNAYVDNYPWWDGIFVIFNAIVLLSGFFIAMSRLKDPLLR